MKRRQQGVALAVVVWFLAAMSLVVAGIVMQARSDVRLAQLHSSRAKAVAAGDGGIQLMLAALVQGQLDEYKGRGTTQRMFELGDAQVSVRLVPVAGLVELNSAPLPLLEQLFLRHGAELGVDPRALAAAVVQWRSAGGGALGARQKRSRFLVVEDLLQVEGMTRTLLDNIRDAVHVGRGAPGGVDWRSAPPAVLALLAPDDPRRAAAAAAEAGETGFSGIVSASSRRGRAGASGTYRVDALVDDGNRVLVRRRWVKMSRGSGSNLPWTFTRSEPARVYRPIDLMAAG